MVLSHEIAGSNPAGATSYGADFQQELGVRFSSWVREQGGREEGLGGGPSATFRAPVVAAAVRLFCLQKKNRR